MLGKPDAQQTSPRSPRWLCRVAGLLLVSLAAVPAPSQDFSLEQWSHKDGLPSNTIYALAQSPDGFLWLGTADGLVRYDGFQFVPMASERFGLRPLGQVRALLTTGDGALLAGGESGVLLRLKDGLAQSQAFNSPLLALTAAAAGGILVETADQERTCLPERRPEAHALFACVRNAAPTSLPASKVVAPDRDARSLKQPSAQSRQETQAIPPKGFRAGALAKVLTGTNGDLWVATRDNGLFVLRSGRILKHFTFASGLSDDRIWDMLLDRDGSLWVATQNGLDRVRANSFLTWSSRSGAMEGAPKDLAPGPDKTLWIATTSGLFSLKAGQKPERRLRSDVLAMQSDSRGDASVLTGSRINTLSAHGMRSSFKAGTGQPSLLASAPDGALWLYGQESGLRSLAPSGNVSQGPALPLLPGQTITRMAAGAGGALWLALSDGTLLLHDGTGDHRLLLQQGSQQETITYLAPQPDGTLWLATDAGLRFLDGRHVLRWDKTSGLPGDRLLWALPDRAGHLWLAYNFGLATVSLEDLKRQAEGKIARFMYELYDDGDGLKSAPEVHGQAPVALTGDGKLWMTIRDGLTMIDPSHLLSTRRPPSTHILAVIADGTELPLGREVQLKPLTRTLTVSYTGISLAAPRKVRYRFRLDGFDNHWQDAAATRSATYTNLPPGSYHFDVTASDGGDWDAAGAGLNLKMLPAYYQTIWFRTLCVFAGLILAAALYQLRLQTKEEFLRVRYEDRLAERNRIAQDLHDNLIQEMMGVSLQLEIAEARTPDIAAAKKSIVYALELAQRAVSGGRAALGTLRQTPLVLAELQRTLRDTAKAAEGLSVIHLTFSSRGTERPLAPEAGAEVLHIAREALRNAIRHSGSRAVHMRTEFSSHQFSLTVHDEGRGFDLKSPQSPPAGHFGVRGMHERAEQMGATLDLRTAPATGTEWRLCVPGSIAYQAGEPRPSSHLVALLLLGLRRIPWSRSKGRR